MEWMKLNQSLSEEGYNKLVELNFDDGYINNNLETEFENTIRSQLCQKYKEVNGEVEQNIEKNTFKKAKRKYYIDVLFGIELYKILNRTGFTIYDAADNDIWRYISIKIIPDIIYDRHGDKPKNFYKVNNRIWLKTIWWYFILARQSEIDNPKICDYNATKEMLLEFNTDYILNIVDRAGTDGFRVELVRQLVKEFYVRREEIKKYLETHTDIQERDIPRSVMILNRARLEVYEPISYKGGLTGYVQDLFDFILRGSI